MSQIENVYDITTNVVCFLALIQRYVTFLRTRENMMCIVNDINRISQTKKYLGHIWCPYEALKTWLHLGW